MKLDLDHLRRYAVARSLFPPTQLRRAVARLRFVQADPLRAPARAQDLILRHRVAGYRMGELEQHYRKLSLEEDWFVNYGFLAPADVALMHPRSSRQAWDPLTRKQAEELLLFVQERGTTHPRDAAAAFDHGQRPGSWGGTRSGTKHLLDRLHFSGLLRVVQREQGVRVYAAVEHEREEVAAALRAQALLEMVVATYAPLPWPSLVYLARLLEYGAPQLRPEIQAALREATLNFPTAVIDGLRWFWPDGENPASRRFSPDEDRVCFLAPFDPVVWDRRRFELLWGWAYKFEAYTPVSQRRFGHYALPVLRGDKVIGWGNLAFRNQTLQTDLGYAFGKPADRPFQTSLAQEIDRMTTFLGAGDEPG